MKPQLVKDRISPEPSNSQSLLTVADVARRLSVSERTVRAWVSEAERWKFPVIKLPTGAIRFDAQAVDAWAKSLATVQE